MPIRDVERIIGKKIAERRKFGGQNFGLWQASLSKPYVEGYRDYARQVGTKARVVPIKTRGKPTAFAVYVGAKKRRIRKR